MYSKKKILIGVGGGIAAYKAADLVREFVKMSAEVRVMMTKAATHFVGPLTFETLTGHPVLTDLFPAQGGSSTAHIDWARWPDVVIICPATLNLVGKMANGIADDALTTTLMATTEKVIFCPAMNKEMYKNSIYQANQQKLVDFGYLFVAPGIGELACGEEGWGRLADKSDILDMVKNVFFGRDDLQDLKMLITAGPTEEAIDPVRYISNRSTGKMGYAIAEAARLRGAQVTLVSGPSDQKACAGVKLVKVRSARDMAAAVKDRLMENDVLIGAAAVGDFRPKEILNQKLKKNKEFNTIELLKNPDILFESGKTKGSRIHVGFSVETENQIENSRIKLNKKNLDFIVINNPLEDDAAFGADTNRVQILDCDGHIEKWPLLSKFIVANKILDKISDIITKKSKQNPVPVTIDES